MFGFNHCAYICKFKEGSLVPNYCCPNISSLTVETVEPITATAVEITGAEAEVKYGELLELSEAFCLF